MTALRAPEADGAVACRPPPAEWPALARRNRAAVGAGLVGGLPRAEWRALARREFAAAANAPLDPGALWFAAGHQPELFHAGVWAKAFAVAGAAAAARGGGLHVRTDNDVAKGLALAVAVAGKTVAQVPFDIGSPEQPWEERRLDDLVYFLDFPARAEEFAGNLAATPAPALWQGFRARLAANPETPLGALFADGRQAVERSWGVDNAEAPLSALCAGEAFRRFAADVLLRAPEFAARHNAALRGFHARGRLRNMPFLRETPGETEAPFWGWTAKDKRRQPLFARASGRALELRCGTLRAEFRLGADPHAELAAALASDFPAKVRPRAVTTTAFLRLGVADLFVHGLGGAKYDAATDALLAEFWGLPPPAFAVATGTLRLPGAPELGPLGAGRAGAQRLVRSLRWNPDRHLPEHLADADALAPALERKAELLEAMPATRAERRARWRAFRTVGDRLRPYVAGELAAAERAAAAAADRETAGKLLAARDFAWCLHPVDRLRSFLLPLARR